MTISTNGPKGSAASLRDWDALNPSLSPWVLEAVAAMGFSSMTPVQASTIPLFMGNKDVVVEAVTGSGKTLSFLIPVVERILRLDVPTKKHHVACIVVAPTRELAIQIDTVLRSLMAFHPASAAIQKHLLDPDDAEAEESATQYSSSPRIMPQLLISGSVSPRADVQQFIDKSPNVLIATPGRLLELLSSPRVHCPQSSFEALVMDEADRLLDLGFKDDLQKILGRLPKQRRTGLFSASVSEALDQLIRVGLRNPVRVSVKVKSKAGKLDQRTPISLDMSYVVTPPSQKLPVLFNILSAIQPTPLRTIVYMSTCAGVDYFQHVLSQLLSQHDPPFILLSLHGKHTPQNRQKNFGRFSESASPTVLLTTDVAARGLDIPQVDFVAQIDPPLDPKVFLHRCGRAGRAGRKGLAVVFLQPGREQDYVPFLEVRQTPIKPLKLSHIETSVETSEAFTEKIRDIVRSDRALHDKAQRGFVSWVQAYRKHHALSIFHLGDLDWTDLAQAWGLLKMPRMPELKNWEGDYSLGVDLNFDEYSYKDKLREKQRQQGVSAAPTVPEKMNPTSTSKRAWSGTLDQKGEREKRRAQKKAKKEHEKQDKMMPAEREKQVELARLIERARALHQKKHEGDDAFEGFSD